MSLDIRAIMTAADIARFEKRFDKTENGCWEWNGKIVRYGYGVFRPHGREGGTHNAHRVSYELYVGPLGEGMAPDHLCLNKKCVRPDHLQAVTVSENSRRAKAWLTHCKYGHPFTAANTYRGTAGKRKCKACYERRTGFVLSSRGPFLKVCTRHPRAI
jgi:hypothetical protein